MAQAITDQFVFRSGSVARTDRLVFVMSHVDADEMDIDHGQFCMLDNMSDWIGELVQWQAVDVASSSSAIVMIGRWGEVFVFDSSGVGSEQIAEAGVDPSQRGPLRRLRVIDDAFVAVGMGRQVWRRLPSGGWTRVENGIPPDDNIMEISGFNSIDGRSGDDMTAVGWGGEIWRYNGSRWNPEDSPTNLALHDIRSTDDGIAWACGQNGVLLRRETDAGWEEIDHGGDELEFRSLAWFADRLFLADGHCLHTWTEDDGLTLVDFGVEEDTVVPSFLVDARDGVLMSLAGKELWCTSDGDNWNEIAT